MPAELPGRPARRDITQGEPPPQVDEEVEPSDETVLDWLFWKIPNTRPPTAIFWQESKYFPPERL